jgi:hypothetical protein
LNRLILLPKFNEWKGANGAWFLARAPVRGVAIAGAML